MNLKTYNPKNFKNLERRAQVFVFFVWSIVILIVSKLIESIFFNNVTWVDILRDFIYGVIILALLIWVIEKGQTIA